MKQDNRPLYILLLVLALVINFLGINLDFFSNDPGLYASISKNLIYRKEFFELFTYSRDWLDKPHFPFWMIWASFKIFGISVWAYRLPALLFFLQGLRYTYLFTKKYYGEEIAWIAVLIASTALNTIICNTDVRAEPYLMALIVGSIFHIDRLEERFNFKDLLLGALLTACAIMTKGIFVIVAIYGENSFIYFAGNGFCWYCLPAFLSFPRYMRCISSLMHIPRRLFSTGIMYQAYAGFCGTASLGAL
jgi:4-amino-4-deoxy-L-arabinose transferase-like glycosyltransferase